MNAAVLLFSACLAGADPMPASPSAPPVVAYPGYPGYSGDCCGKSKCCDCSCVKEKCCCIKEKCDLHQAKVLFLLGQDQIQVVLLERMLEEVLR